MQEAARAPDVKADDKETYKMISQDTVEVLEFFSSLLPTEDMEILQDIEHDSFWINYHRGNNEDVHKAALAIRDSLDSNNEYWVFKILVGFEGVFEDWEEPKKKGAEDFERIRELRISEANKFVSDINEETYDVWKDRILSYAKIESEDLATFPNFGKFLERFGSESPELALKLIQENTEQLERFLVAVLDGLWQGARDKTKELLLSWVVQGKYIVQSIRLFSYVDQLDTEILDMCLKQAIDMNDTYALNCIISSVAHNFDENNKELIARYFITSLVVLTKNENANWIYDFWFRKNRDEILGAFY